MTIQNETIKFADSRLNHPKPQPPPRSYAGERNYNDAKAAFLRAVAEPRRLTGNARLDGQAWDARLAEYSAAKKQFDFVASNLDPLNAIVFLVDYRQTLRDASKLLDATIEPPPVRYQRIDDGIDRTSYVYFADPIHGDLLLGTIEEPDDHGRFRAIAADGTDLGKFADQKSARAAIQIDAGK